MSCVLIDRAVLRTMYVQELRSAQDIARHFNCSEMTIRRRLRRFNIPPRSRGPCVERQRARAEMWQQSWSAKVAYLVGLIASDGNLGRKKPVITLVSKDIDLLETARGCLALKASITRHGGERGGQSHRLTWYDYSLYQWLCDIGLTPAKSLTLSPLDLPEEYFVDFFRGCIDGDGSIVVYTDRQHVAISDRYVYERLYLSIVSASYAFIDWVRATVRRLTTANGSISMKTPAGAHAVWTLRYAKAESIQLLRWMYYAPDIPCLARKRATAEKFLTPVGHATRATGRPRVGWIYNTDAPRS